MVRLQSPSPPSGLQRGNVAPIITDCKGIYRATLPDDRRFLVPTNEKFYQENIKIADGEIWVTLELEPDTIPGGDGIVAK